MYGSNHIENYCKTGGKTWQQAKGHIAVAGGYSDKRPIRYQDFWHHAGKAASMLSDIWIMIVAGSELPLRPGQAVWPEERYMTRRIYDIPELSSQQGIRFQGRISAAMMTKLRKRLLQKALSEADFIITTRPYL